MQNHPSHPCALVNNEKCQEKTAQTWVDLTIYFLCWNAAALRSQAHGSGMTSNYMSYNPIFRENQSV